MVCALELESQLHCSPVLGRNTGKQLTRQLQKGQQTDEQSIEKLTPCL